MSNFDVVLNRKKINYRVENKPQFLNVKIAVCVHLYHIDMLDSIMSHLSNIEQEYDLYFGLINKPYDQSFLNKLQKLHKNTRVFFVENIGMDIGGFLQVYKQIDKSYDLILKLHTKKGVGSPESPSLHVKKHGVKSALEKGSEWYHELMKGVLGDKNKVKKIIEEFKKNKDCGMVGYKLYHNHTITKNNINNLLKFWSINMDLKDVFFIGGTIFWVDNNILKKYFTNDKIDEILKNLPSGYAVEPSNTHAMERIFGYFVKEENKKILIL